ncbi:MAG: dynamin [Chloroflexi bacterium]|nr:dynamin [Chloroflexota bacterium]
MHVNFLNNEQFLFLQQEKQTLTESLLTLSELKLAPELIETLKQAILQLDEFFLLVTVGEFNAGKSALINALLGARVLKEGVTPTTARVTLVRYGDNEEEQIINDGFAIYTYPLPLLQHLNIVDSPGTNAIIREHEILTNEYVPRSDLVLFVTSADRPMTESERQFLQKILAWGKKIILVVNKADILEADRSINEVRGFVLDAARKILSEEPELFMVSAKLGQKAAQTNEPEVRTHLWAVSGLAALENYITHSLDDKKRLELKLRSPLGVLTNVNSQALANNEAQKQDLQADSQLVALIESAINNYERELQAEISPRLAEVESVLQRFELRGQEFFDNTFKLSNIATLAKPEKVRSKFEHEVVSDISQEIDEKVHNLIDWLVDKDLHTWYQVASMIERRQASSEKVLPSGDENPHASKRAELISDVGQTIKNVLSSYDRQKEADEVHELVKDTISQTALFEAGALGIGALVATIITSRALDVTGIVAASTLAILGLFVIPYRRKLAKEQFKSKMDELRKSLMQTLKTTINVEFSGAIKRLRDHVAPYISYVHSEQDKVDSEALSLESIKQRAQSLQDQITKLLM